MPDYQNLYHQAFNTITDAERLIETATQLLRRVQQECEELIVQEEVENNTEEAKS